MIGSAQPLGDQHARRRAAGVRRRIASRSARRGRRCGIGDRVFHGLTAGIRRVRRHPDRAGRDLPDRQGHPAIADDKSNFLFSRDWSVDGATLRFGVLDLLWVTVIISLLAMVIAVPIAIGIALFITQYAPKRLARPVAYVVDLLAAIPSIIYGIWGITVLAPKLEPVQRALYHLGAFTAVQGQERRAGHDLQRRRRARGHDPADHHRDRPRRVRADAARRTSRRPGRSAPPAGR